MTLTLCWRITKIQVPIFTHFVTNNFVPFRPPHVHHHFSIEALIGVLKRAMQKRKYIRDEKTQDKLDTRKEESSRSNSQASDAPSRPVLPAQSSTGIYLFAYQYVFQEKKSK